jgi:glycosyltransferase involved in cell wall biosynthesis
MSMATSTQRRPIRVLMIAPDHLMIDRRILQEAQTLRQAGYAVEILVGFECPVASSYETDGVRIKRFKFDWQDSRVDWVSPLLCWAPQRWRNGLRRIGRRLALLITGRSSFERYVLQQIMASSFDILHCHDFPLLAVAVEAKRRRMVPIVYDAHELYHAQAQLPVKTQNRYRRRESRLIRHANLIITVNPLIARVMAKDYGCAMPEVLLNAAPKISDGTGGAGLRELLGLNKHDQIVLYQGWMSRERGIDRLVEAARNFPPHVRLVLIGYGDHELELRDLSIKQGTNDGRVIFVGRIASKDLAALTRSADLGVIPYHNIDLNNYYSSPNKLFEYAAAGLPFISNDLPFLRSIIDKYGFGTVANLTEPQAAVAAILSILDDRPRLAAMRKSAEQAAAELNWEREGEKLLALYARIEIPLRDSAPSPGSAQRSDA